MNKKAYKVYKTIMIIVLTAFITFMITTTGMFTYLQHGGKLAMLNTEKQDEIGRELEKYKLMIDKYYLGEVDEEKLKEGAIRGYIDGLEDPYTEYISKEEMEDYMNEALGNYKGIGIYMVKDKETNKVKVLTPIKGSPAEKAGILPGDLILEVNDKKYSADEMEQMSKDIKGEEGTEVKLKLLRKGDQIELNIKRENIKMNIVEGKVLENKIGYINFTSFDETTAEDFKNKYEELNKQGIKSLIIDLRNNGGGIVDEAIKIADYMTNKGDILLYEVDKNGNEKTRKSEKDPIINMPIVILTNENTASASEILAGALKDLGKAKIVGTKTFGKGVIQQILSLRDRSGLKITVEEYQTPNHNKINKVGIEPDEKVELKEEYKNKLIIPEKEDTQLKKAIEILK